MFAEQQRTESQIEIKKSFIFSFESFFVMKTAIRLSQRGSSYVSCGLSVSCVTSNWNLLRVMLSKALVSLWSFWKLHALTLKLKTISYLFYCRNTSLDNTSLSPDISLNSLRTLQYFPFICWNKGRENSFRHSLAHWKLSVGFSCGTDSLDH